MLIVILITQMYCVYSEEEESENNNSIGPAAIGGVFVLWLIVPFIAVLLISWCIKKNQSEPTISADIHSPSNEHHIHNPPNT